MPPKQVTRQPRGGALPRPGNQNLQGLFTYRSPTDLTRLSKTYMDVKIAANAHFSFQVKGLEVEPISQMPDWPRPGVKIQLKGALECRRGIILLR